MSGFCGAAVCSARIQVWLVTPDDGGITDPCRECRAGLETLLGLPPADTLPTLRGLYRALRAAGRAP